MTSSLDQNLKRLMLQYLFEVDNDSINDDLKCLICDRLMVDAYQTYCGCQYCHACIVQYLLDGDKYCRGGKNECKEEYLLLDRNVTKNAQLVRKVFKTRVHCPNKSCPYVTELTLMEVHLRECVKPPMECPFLMVGCDTQGAFKGGILNHLHKGTFAHSQLLIEFLYNQKNEIEYLKEKIKDFQIDELKKEMIEEKYEYIRSTNKQEIEIDNQKKETEQLKREIKDLKEESKKREIMMEELKKEMTILAQDRLKKERTNSRNEIRSKITEISTKESAVVATPSMNDVRARVNELEEAVARVKEDLRTNIVSFTADRFSERKTPGDEIFSPYFYSHTNGYKLRLRVHPGGCGVGNGTHMSMFIQICKGEYDDVLPWPCRHTFTLSIANQHDGGTHASMTIDYANARHNHKYSFVKPINKENVGRGNNTFVSHEDLQSVVGLVVEDSVIVRCAVSAPK